jgi:hypothetical protein
MIFLVFENNAQKCIAEALMRSSYMELASKLGIEAFSIIRAQGPEERVAHKIVKCLKDRIETMTNWHHMLYMRQDGLECRIDSEVRKRKDFESVAGRNAITAQPNNKVLGGGYILLIDPVWSKQIEELGWKAQTYDEYEMLTNFQHGNMDAAMYNEISRDWHCYRK